MKSILVSIVALASLSSADGGFSNVPGPLDAAMSNSVEDGERADWRFTMTIDSADGQVVGRYDGAVSEEGSWTLVSPARDAMTEGQAAIWEDIIDPSEDEDEGGGLFFDPDDIEMEPGTFSLLSEEGARAVYAFAPLLDTDEAEFADALSGELVVDGSDPQIRQIRVFARDSFKPHMAVRINEFEIVQEYAPMDGMPAPVLQRFSQVIRGSAAFQSFEESVEIRFSEIEYIAQ